MIPKIHPWAIPACRGLAEEKEDWRLSKRDVQMRRGEVGQDIFVVLEAK